MRIQVLLTGISDDPTLYSYEEIKRVFPNSEVVLDIVTWEEMLPKDFVSHVPEGSLHEVSFSVFEEEVQILKDRMKYSLHGLPIENSLYMFALWKAARDCIRRDCDIVFKARIDNKFFCPDGLDFNREDAFLAVPRSTDFNGGIGDHIAYGPPSSLDDYLSIFDELSEIYAMGYVFHPERYLRVHLSNRFPNVLRPNMLVVYRYGNLYLHKTIIRSSNLVVEEENIDIKKMILKPDQVVECYKGIARNQRGVRNCARYLVAYFLARFEKLFMHNKPFHSARKLFLPKWL